MLNQEIAAFFYRLAWLTSLAGEPVFKTAAYRKAARAIAAEQRPLAGLRRDGLLRQVPGIGDKIEAKVAEILDTGRLKTVDRLRAAAPPGRQPRVVVVGSLNMDLVAWAPRRPARGESLAGTRFATFLGGKGFNQAVAAARLGAAVTIVGRVGQDDFGASFLAGLKAAGVDSRHVTRDPETATGVGLPLVEPDGANSIVVVLGANMTLSPAHVDAALESIATADVLMLQLEVPQEASLQAARLARAAGVAVMLNPAPAQAVSPELLRLSDWLTPNEVEAGMLAGKTGQDAGVAARELLAGGTGHVLVTLGAKGCLLVTAEAEEDCPAFDVTAVDTTAAGDAFCAGLAVALAEGQSDAIALRFASAAGALAVTVAGAEPSLPGRAAVDRLVAGQRDRPGVCQLTERLYYGEPDLVEFTAVVTERLTIAKQPAVVLDRSAFYPESGGQPGDHGELNGVRVTNTLERDEDKAVVHVLGGALAGDSTGEVVTGRVDRARRLDHMQQHTGQHVLSQAFERLLGAETVSFHLGDEVVTIDLALDALTPEQAAAVEDAANQVVRDDLPVTCRFVTSADLAALPLRKPPKVAGPIRIVEVSGYDWSPCGGTHVARAGQIGLIALRKWERRGATVRVDFLCGRRALLDYRWKNAAVNRLASGLSVKDRELAETVERLVADGTEARRQLNFARERLLDVEAAELRDAAPESGVVEQSWADRPAEELRRLAQRLAERPNTLALLGSAAGGKANLVFARSSDRAEDVNVLLKAVAPLVGGRGGGTAALAQGGGGEVAGLAEALARAAALVNVDLKGM